MCVCVCVCHCLLMGCDLIRKVVTRWSGAIMFDISSPMANCFLARADVK